MVVSDVDEWNSDSGEDDRDDQGYDEDVQEVIHATSATGGSVKSILLFPEKNEEDTGWLSDEGIKPSSVFNKMKPEDCRMIPHLVVLSGTNSTVLRSS